MLKETIIRFDTILGSVIYGYKIFFDAYGKTSSTLKPKVNGISDF
jgi:hypothetical protein